MRLVAFSIKETANNGSAPRLGVLTPDGRRILDLSEVGGQARGETISPDAPSCFDLDKPWLARAIELYRGAQGGETLRGAVPRESAQLHAPAPRPGKIICIGLNYRDHAEESNLPVPERGLSFQNRRRHNALCHGDLITIDVNERRLDVELSGEQIAERLQNWQPRSPLTKAVFSPSTPRWSPRLPKALSRARCGVTEEIKNAWRSLKYRCGWTTCRNCQR